MCEVLYLVKNGVPWDVAMGLDQEERLGFVIRLGSFEGGKFNWITGQWEKP